jgi:ABC-2 type transport system ATP-binding protein
MQINLKNVSKSIKGFVVLSDITLKLSSGKIYGLRGRNGTGKTMLLRTLCGLTFPTSGDMFIDGIVLDRKAPFPKSVGVLIERPGFIDTFSGLKNLTILASIKNVTSENDIKMFMQLFDLDPNDKKPVRAYSLGMKQKLGIISALMEYPDLVLLDEPLNALDDQSAKKVLKLLMEHKERGALIVVASHDFEELGLLADEIIEIGGVV